MKRFLIALGSILIVASAVCIIVRLLKNQTGEGGDEFDDCEWTEDDEDLKEEAGDIT